MRKLVQVTLYDYSLLGGVYGLGETDQEASRNALDIWRKDVGTHKDVKHATVCRRETEAHKWTLPVRVEVNSLVECGLGGHLKELKK